MKFSDKCAKLRKDNNLSQELLAEKMNVSRQAVSKWESGQSYPDMEKMLQLCKIFNCTLDELMDDGALGKIEKLKAKDVVDDLLKLVTNVYNMFLCMKFKQKISCLFEMAVIVFILFLISFFTISVVSYFIGGILSFNGSWIINRFITNILWIICIGIGILITFHLFKIRYLDYYVTIVDDTVSEKSIEEAVDKKEFNSSKKEKIIIRDVNHGLLKPFRFLGKMIVVCMRSLTFFFFLMSGLMFVVLMVGFFFFVIHAKINVLFVCLSIFFLALSILLYPVIDSLYGFVFNKATVSSYYLRMLIVGGVLLGFSLAGTMTCAFNFKQQETVPEYLKRSDVLNVKMADNLVIIDYGNTYTYRIDETKEDIEIIATYLKWEKVEIQQVDSEQFKVTQVVTKDYFTPIDGYRLLVDSAKRNETFVVDHNEKRIEIVANSKVIEQLKNNSVAFKK